VKVLLVHNPDAGTAGETTGGLVAALTAGGHQVEDILLEGDRWQAALDTPADVIVAAGGDGTARTVAIALATSPHVRTPLAILAQGTANNIARSLGMPEEPGELARGLAGADRSRLTIGCVRAPFGVAHFVESAGVGVFATMLRSSRHIRQRRSRDERIAAGIEHLRKLLEDANPVEVAVTADGEDYSGCWLMAQAMNIIAAGSRVELAPGADPADTALDLVLIGERDRELVLDYLARLARGEDVESPLASRRCRRITMGWPQGAGHIDDHAWPESDVPRGTEVGIEVATAIPVLVPR